MFLRRVWPASPYQRAGFVDPIQLRREMDRLFDGLWPGDTPGPGVFPAMNVTQDNDRYYVRAELPGVRTNDLQIAVERNKLSVSGKREIVEEGDGVSYHRRERMGGSFSRSLTLPDDLNADAVDASYKDGVLTIVLPKAEAVKAREIRVKAG
jgi:HSP20 family protein